MSFPLNYSEILVFSSSHLCSGQGVAETLGGCGEARESQREPRGPALPPACSVSLARAPGRVLPHQGGVGGRPGAV